MKTARAEPCSALSLPVEAPLAPGVVTISCDEHALPPFIEKELDQLYQQLNSSLMHHAVRKKAKTASTYIARKDGQPIAIFLFTREKQRISVINEMIDIPGEELERFSRYIFTRYAPVTQISFSLIGKSIGRLALPYQQHDSSEDIVLILPQTPAAYLESLSPKTRRNIRRYLRAIKHEHPTFRHETTVGAAIPEQHLQDLIELKKKNIGDKNLRFGLAEEELSWIVRQARLTGLVTVALINEKVCGGSISLRVGDHYFGQVISYDPAYQKYSLGILCTYLTVSEQILHGGKESHLCWGRYQYKYKLAGIQRDRASLDIYRSRAAWWRHAGEILLKKIRTTIKDGKNWLLDQEHAEGKTAQAAATLVSILRKIKRARSAA